MHTPYKWLGLFSIVLFVGCGEKSGNSFTVKGTVKNANAAVIFLEEASQGDQQPVILDSAKLEKDGSFTLSTTAREENLYILRTAQQATPVAMVINDVPSLSVSADLANMQQFYSVKGSPASQSLVDFISKSNTQLSSIYALRLQQDSLSRQQKVDSALNAVGGQHQAAAASFKSYVHDVLKNSNSPALSLFVLGSYQSYVQGTGLGLQPFSETEAADIINKTASKFPKHTGLASVRTQLQQSQALQQQTAAGGSLLNKPAPDFTLPDVNGTPVSLSSFKGKYVLVDFWASWCKPCRIENPNLVKAYQQFKNKNFTVLGVSLDKEKNPWTSAIKNDDLTWTHVSDLKFWESMVVPMYNIEGIPYNVLLDPNGIVIAENLRGEELIAKLAEVIK